MPSVAVPESLGATASEDGAEVRRGWVTPAGWIALLISIVFGATLRGVRLGELPGGYLVFNEGFYIDEALREAARAPWDWFVHPLLYDKPPLYVGVVQTLYRLHLPEVAAARFVSVAAGIATICLVFLFARLLYDERTAIASAAVIAVMPGVVLVDHNIQVDPLFVALMMASLVLYLVALRTARTRDAVIAGCVLGVAILTKQPAVLALPAVAAWDVWRTRSIRELLSRRFVAFAGAALALGASWYMLELLIAPRALIGGMLATGGRTPLSSLPQAFWSVYVGSELLWMMFPLAAVLACVGVGYMLWRRLAGDKLVLICLAVFLAYYIPFHLHSYYLLPTAPFLAVAIARGVMGPLHERFASPVLRYALLGLLFAAMALGSVLMLSGQKWGYWSPMSIAADSGSYVIDANLAAFVGPSFDPGASSPPRALSPTQYLALPPGEAPEFISFQVHRGDGSAIPPTGTFTDTVVAPVVFGVAIAQRRWSNPSGTQRFTNATWDTKQVGPVWQFSVMNLSVPSAVMAYDRQSLSGGASP